MDREISLPKNKMIFFNLFVNSRNFCDLENETEINFRRNGPKNQLFSYIYQTSQVAYAWKRIYK